MPETGQITFFQRMPFLLRFALAFGAGWLGSYAMPPTAFWPLLLPAVSLLILLLLGARGIWSGFALAWAYGFAFHLFGLSWIGEAFLVDAARFGWMRPFAVSGLPAGLALLTGLAGMAFVKLRSARPVWDAFLFAVLF